MHSPTLSTWTVGSAVFDRITLLVAYFDTIDLSWVTCGVRTPCCYATRTESEIRARQESTVACIVYTDRVYHRAHLRKFSTHHFTTGTLKPSATTKMSEFLAPMNQREESVVKLVILRVTVAYVEARADDANS